MKTNSKKARENVRRYIFANFSGINYDYTATNYTEAAHFIYKCFKTEKANNDSMYKAGRVSERALFEDWAAGLPSVIDTCYYYNRSAVSDLAEILEESPTEAARYTESDAERLLTYLIYDEIKKAVGK